MSTNSSSSRVSLPDLIAICRDLFPSLDPVEQRLHGHLLRALAEGRPVSPQRLRELTGYDTETVDRFVEDSRRTHWAYLDDSGNVIGFSGLALREISPHRVTVDGRTLFAWCAWDTLFLPRLLRKTIDVRSVCPQTGGAIELCVSPERVERLTPPGAAMSFVTPERSRITQDVFLSFCHFVHFFVSEKAGLAWQNAHGGALILSVEDGFTVGRELVNAKFAEFLSEERSGRARTEPERAPLAEPSAS